MRIYYHYLLKKSVLILMLISLQAIVFAQRPMEFLNRGLVVQERNGGGTFLTWRMLGTDPRDVAFNLYRNGTKVNASPLTGATNYTDNSGNISANYQVETIYPDGATEMSANSHLFPLSTTSGRARIPIKRIPLTPPVLNGIEFYPGNMSTGDLDGDGTYELILEWETNTGEKLFS